MCARVSQLLVHRQTLGALRGEEAQNQAKMRYYNLGRYTGFNGMYSGTYINRTSDMTYLCFQRNCTNLNRVIREG